LHFTVPCLTCCWMASKNGLPVSSLEDRSAALPGGGLRVHAPGKINLNLLVGPRRVDGCHPVDSIVAKVALYDRLDLQPRADGQIRLRCRGPSCGPDEHNLAFRAAKLLAEHTGCTTGVDIELTKGIAPGRGLGGGSSDAAAVLWGLNGLWSLRLQTETLAALAGRLGSDVPLFHGSAASRVTGRGECVEPVQLHPFVAVLLLPDCSCSTAAVYRAFDERPSPMGWQMDLRVLAEPPSAWRGGLKNELAGAARNVCPEMGRLWDELAAAVALPVHLTGSGSGMFVLCDDEAEASAVMARLPRDLPCETLVARGNPW